LILSLVRVTFSSPGEDADRALPPPVELVDGFGEGGPGGGGLVDGFGEGSPGGGGLVAPSGVLGVSGLV
jgi:hypothetical protein